MADPLDVIGIDEARDLINLGDTQVGSDEVVARMVTVVSRRFDGLCGPIVKRTVTDEAHDGGSGRLFLRQAPIFLSSPDVTVVKEYTGTVLTTLTAESNTSQVANQFLIDFRLGILYRRSGGADYLFPCGRGNVLVTYEAGRYADTDAVDEPFRSAAALTVKELWKVASPFWQRQSGFAETEAVLPSLGRKMVIPPMVLDMLADELAPMAVA